MEIRSFDELRENLRCVFELDLKTAESEFAADSHFFMLDRVLLSSYRITPIGFDHDPTRLRQFDNEFVALERYFTGSARGMADETSAVILPGTLCLIDWSRRFRAVTREVSGHSLLIPHDLVGYDPSRHPAFRTLATGSTGGSLLTLTLDRLFAATRAEDREEAALCLRLSIDLVRSLFLADEDNSGWRGAFDPRTRDYLARSYIQRHLSDPELNPARLGRRLNMSRATVYRVFAEEGGVARYIDGLRLDRCFGALLHAPRRRGAVRRIAEAWGFHDAAVFNRKFRRRFGMAPSDALARETRDPLPGSRSRQVWPVNRWLRRPPSIGSDLHS